MFFIDYFFLHYTAPTEIYTYLLHLSLPDALPVCSDGFPRGGFAQVIPDLAVVYRQVVLGIDIVGIGPQAALKILLYFDHQRKDLERSLRTEDRKSTRLNSSH